MVCPYYEKCATIRCDKPSWAHNIIKKWVEDKQNASVIGHANNQALMARLAQDQKHVCVVFEGTLIRSVANSCSCKQSIKEACKWRYDCTTRFSKGYENRYLGLIKFKYLTMVKNIKKCKSWHVSQHQEK